ncbi:MAG: putative Ig domain-containing protein [Holophaga sp.]|nr:putative Ig domain-containing protein [Holophaga sp.]
MGMALLLGLLPGCGGGAFCDRAEPPSPAPAHLAAAYTDVSTTYGTPLTVAPAVAGVVTSAVLDAGTIPPGMVLNQDGSITGTPIQPGPAARRQAMGISNPGMVYPVTITLANATTSVQCREIITINSPTADPVLVAYTDAAATVATATSVEPTVTSGGPVVSAVLVQGALPPGLALSAATGAISGTPTAAGIYPLSVAFSSAVSVATAPLVLSVAQASSIPLVAGYSNVSRPVGVSLSVAPGTVSGGPIVASRRMSGLLPPGLALNPDGSLSGVPSAAGTYTLKIELANASGGATTQPLTLTINLSAAPPPEASYCGLVTTLNSAVSLAPVLSGSDTIVSAQLVNGSIPPGLALNPDGSLTGTASATGLYTMTIRVCGSGGGCQALPLTITVSARLTLTYPSAPAFTFGAPIATQAPALGNAAPAATTSYSVTTGSLPEGLTLNPDGTITGAPLALGSFPLTITATQGSRTATFQLSYTVLAVPPAVSAETVTETMGATTPLAPANTGGAITGAAITAGGALPAGLTLNPDGTISQSGSTASGIYGPFTVSYSNTGGSVSATVTITISNPNSAPSVSPLTVTENAGASAPLAPANLGGAITSAAVTAGGPLAAGLALNADGSISQTGTTAAGTYAYTVGYTNGFGTGYATVTITVVSLPTANLAANPANVPVTQASSLTAVFTGSADGTALLTQTAGTGFSSRTVVSGTSITTGIEAAAGTVGSYQLTATSPTGAVATASASVQWIAAPASSWVVEVPNAGGSFSPSSGPLTGLIALAVPDQGQSPCGDVTLSVYQDSATVPGTPGGGAVACSPLYNLATNVGYPFRVPITVTLAYDTTLVGANDIPVPFLWDATYRQWVATGLESFTASTVTFSTLLPGCYQVLGIPGLALATQTLGSPGFTAGTDDWQQNDPTAYDLPGGASLAMSSFASWFYADRKATQGGAGLFNAWASAGDGDALTLVGRLGNGTLDAWANAWRQTMNASGTTPAPYALTGQQTGLALITGLMVTGQPQILLMADSPALSSAVATAVYGYDFTGGSFRVMDPNYPGDALTIAWNAGTGAFSGYARAQGYAPALAQYAFEGQGSIHRPSDYDTLFTGALGGFPAPTYASINVTGISSAVTTPLDLGTPVLVTSATGIQVTGTVSNGDQAATCITWSQNGQAPRKTVPLIAGGFSFTIPALDNAYQTTVVLETSPDPCDPTFSHTGYRQFVLAQQGLTPWFGNPCFENGTGTASSNTQPWVLQHCSNSGVYYPGGAGSSYNTAAPVFAANGADLLNYQNSSHAPAALAWITDNDGTAAATAMTPAAINAQTASSTSSSAVLNPPGNGTGPYTALVGCDASSELNVDAQVPTETAISVGGVATPATGNGLTMVLAGSYSLMVNDPTVKNHVSRAYQTITVPDGSVVSSPTLAFYWAGATQSGGHTPDQLPYIDIVVQDVTDSYAVLYYVHHFAPSTVNVSAGLGTPPQGVTYTDGYPGWITAGLTGPDGSSAAYVWWGIPWQKVRLNLGTARGGHTIQLSVVASCCAPGGHGAYAYVDSMTCE